MFSLGFSWTLKFFLNSPGQAKCENHCFRSIRSDFLLVGTGISSKFTRVSWCVGRVEKHRCTPRRLETNFNQRGNLELCWFSQDHTADKLWGHVQQPRHSFLLTIAFLWMKQKSASWHLFHLRGDQRGYISAASPRNLRKSDSYFHIVLFC